MKDEIHIDGVISFGYVFFFVAGLMKVERLF